MQHHSLRTSMNNPCYHEEPEATDHPAVLPPTEGGAIIWNYLALEYKLSQPLESGWTF